MNPTHSREQLENEHDQLRHSVFATMDEPTFGALLTAAFDPGDPVYVDPDFARLLAAIFNDRSEGRLESLRMATDSLRRVSTAQDTQTVFRPFGVMELCLPVQHKGQTCHAIFSGPLKIGAWTPRELQTLSRISGVAEGRFPPALTACQTFTEEHVTGILRPQLETRARVLEHALDTLSVVAPVSDIHFVPGQSEALEMLYSGLPDHLQTLFASILETASFVTQPHEADQLRHYAHRGTHLLSELIAVRDRERSRKTNFDLHALLTTIIETMRIRFPSVHFSEPGQGQRLPMQGAAGSLQHLIGTLISAVADGLGTTGGSIGISTRHTEQEERECVQIEIRDGGGFATFAGVEPMLDEMLQQEQNDLSDEFADWVMMAETMDANVSIHTEDQIVTRINLYIPVNATEPPTVSPQDQGTPQVWIVDDDPTWAHTLRQMLSPREADVTQLSSGAALQEHFSSAPLPADLIILDMHLEDIRGHALRTWIYEQDSDLPVILISSMAATHPGIQTATGLRKTMFLQKPFDATELRNLVSMSLTETVADG